MRFTPTAFFGTQLGTFDFTANGGITGSFSSGGIDYEYIKFTSGSYTLNVTTGAEIDMLIVGGGGGGNVDGLTPAGVGGGGGGVYYTTTRLYKGTYNVIVGQGGTQNTTGSISSISAYGYSYLAEGGNQFGTSGLPTSNIPGNNIQCTVQNNSAGGGGASAAQTGSNAFCGSGNIAAGGAGGEGLTYNMDGTPSVYGSGGGGGSSTSAFAQGGNGGTNAGKGASYNTDATNATNGFGGGGGGERAGNPGQAGSGGHGIVIIRYRL